MNTSILSRNSFIEVEEGVERRGYLWSCEAHRSFVLQQIAIPGCYVYRRQLSRGGNAAEGVGFHENRTIPRAFPFTLRDDTLRFPEFRGGTRLHVDVSRASKLPGFSNSTLCMINEVSRVRGNRQTLNLP